MAHEQETYYKKIEYFRGYFGIKDHRLIFWLKFEVDVEIKSKYQLYIVNKISTIISYIISIFLSLELIKAVDDPLKLCGEGFALCSGPFKTLCCQCHYEKKI